MHSLWLKWANFGFESFLMCTLFEVWKSMFDTHVNMLKSLGSPKIFIQRFRPKLAIYYILVCYLTMPIACDVWIQFLFLVWLHLKEKNRLIFSTLMEKTWSIASLLVRMTQQKMIHSRKNNKILFYPPLTLPPNFIGGGGVVKTGSKHSLRNA